MKSANYLITLFSSLLFISCTSTQPTSMTPSNKQPDPITENGTQIISAPVVYKSFVKKNGEVTDQTEMYLQRSIQDYFIKFCESSVSREELELHLASMDGLIKSVTFEVSFVEGSWDICDDNIEQQSRIGTYVVLHRIVKP